VDMKPFWNWMGLVVVAGIVAVLARNPRIVSNFFSGATAYLGTALAGGQSGGRYK
jgi:hypothetical protein